MNRPDTSIAHIVNIFPTFYITQKFSGHDTYKDAVFAKEFIEGELDEVPHVRKTLSSPYNTFPCVTQDDDNLDHDVFPEFMRDLEMEVSSMLYQSNLVCRSEILNVWYNIYDKNNFHERHTHIGGFTQLSGVYFYKNPGANEFAFFNPLTKFLEGSNHSNSLFYNSDLHQNSVDIGYPIIEEGDIILFPPFLEHSVYPISEDSTFPRITFSFNCRLLPEEESAPSPEVNQVSFVTN